jgi:hypothetical protein
MTGLGLDNRGLLGDLLDQFALGLANDEIDGRALRHEGLSQLQDRSMPPPLKLANTSATRRAALVAREGDVEVIS